MFKIIESNEDFLKIVCIRAIVFIHEQKCPYKEEIDRFDQKSVNILGEEKEEPFACGRIRFIDDFVKLERIALRLEWRKRGLGKKLLEFMIQKAHTSGFNKFKINAQLHAVPFYEKNGFKAYGNIFMEAGIKHIAMIKRKT